MVAPHVHWVCQFSVMKKNNRNNGPGNRLLLRFRNTLAFDGNGAVVATYSGPKTSRKRKYTPRPHLEKIGGMEKDVRDYVAQFCDLSAPSTSILRTSVSESIRRLPKNFSTIINLKRVNDVRGINRFLAEVNQHLPEGGLLIGCVETKFTRKQRIRKKLPLGLYHIYILIDFVFKRVFPKLPVTRFIYRIINGERNKVLSRTEMLGRLYAAGFEVKDKKFIHHHLYFIAKKVKAPLFDYEPVYGPIFRMRRHGKNGEVIHVYKMRTMHAYSEFIQQYVYERNKLADGGKMKDDFRVSTLGKFFRKYWIDELPMLLNLLRGDLKLVGVRPLSAHYLSLYSDELKRKRELHKPGLIPPFYADLPRTLEEIQASEMKYLTSYERHPLITDIRYFFKAGYNIVFRRARSK